MDSVSGASALPVSESVVVTTPLTDTQRIENIERVLRDYIDNPPKLADSVALNQRIDSVQGMADSALRQIGSISDSLPDRVSQVEQRVMKNEQNVQLIADAKAVTIQQVVRDLAHETKVLMREFLCKCGVGFSDSVVASQTNNPTKSCPNCGASCEAINVTDAPDAAT